jgi:hypothetical protein
MYTWPSPSSFCMMKPFAAEEAGTERFWNAMPMLTPFAAQRKLSFWQIRLAVVVAQIQRA